MQLAEAKLTIQELRGGVGTPGAVGPSPERRHKRAKGDSPEDSEALQSPPDSVFWRDPAQMSEWQRVITDADDVWRSFEPILLDDELTYSWLLSYLGCVVENRKNTERFMDFVQSDAQGWFCASNVVQCGWTDPRSGKEAGCKRHKTKRCIGVHRVPDTRKIEFRAF